MLFTYCFVWPIIKTLVNGACSPTTGGYLMVIFGGLDDPSKAIRRPITAAKRKEKGKKEQ